MRARPELLILTCAACVVPAAAPRGLRVDLATRMEVRVAPAAAVALTDAPVVEFFGIPLEDAQDVVFVLDVSGSMTESAQGALAQIRVRPRPVPAADPLAAPAPPPAPVVAPRKIDVAQSELVDVLERLPPGTRLNVLWFQSDVEGAAQTLFVLDEAARATAIELVWDLGAAGSTALAPALRTAYLMNPRRVVLLSDGLGNVGGDADAIVRDAREAIRGGLRIDAIGIGTGHDAALLDTLARESGGLYQPL